MDTSPEVILELIRLLGDSNSEFSSSGRVIRLSDSDGVRQFLTNENISFSPVRSFVEIEIEALAPLVFFWNIDDFLRGASQRIDSSSQVLIYNEGNSFIWDGFRTTIVKPDIDGYKYLFEVVQGYLKIKSFLIDLENNVDKNQQFLEYYNEGSEKFLLSSHVDSKRVTIAFPDHIPKLDFNKNIYSTVEKFISCFNSDSKHLPVFVKNAVIDFLHNKKESSRAIDFFNDLEQILEAAQLNFNVYLNNLSIDKIKREYKEYKKGYFDQYSSLVSKISTQIITLPVTAIGSGIAIDRVTNNYVLAIILAVIIVVSVFIGAIVYHYRGDLNFLMNSFYSDYEKLMGNRFFEQHPDEIEDFESVKGSFKTKTDYLKNYLSAYYWIGLILNSLLIIMVAHKISLPNWSIIVLISLFLVIAIVHFLSVRKQD